MSDENRPPTKVWVLSCRCGWSRMVPRSTPAERRRQIIQEHRVTKHPDSADGEG